MTFDVKIDGRNYSGLRMELLCLRVDGLVFLLQWYFHRTVFSYTVANRFFTIILLCQIKQRSLCGFLFVSLSLTL